MITVSLCMIVKNEEDVIGRCLSSVASAVDEIIIVDTGSTDRTKEIAGSFVQRIYDFEWIDDFAAARNYAFGLATKDYILWLDADDVIQRDQLAAFVSLKETLDPSVDSVTMAYHLAFDEFGNVTSSVRRNRLVKRSNNFRWIGAVHEYLEVWGQIYNSDIAVTHSSLRHDSDRNINIYERRLGAGEQFSPRDLYYYANELLDHSKPEMATRYYEQFLATGKGWIEDNISACGKLADCYHQLGNEQLEFESALRSFRYDRPRPEFCCRLGYHFLNKQEFQTAIFWYNLATLFEPSEQQMGFRNEACSTWLPHLQLCLCYDRIGEYKLAYLHNERARRYRPKDRSILHNKSYLEGVLKNSESIGQGEAYDGK
ncbi:glycosyltransferase family 2 protein [Paenibacillus doosanensis]|uniref:tetratricopeptide repeat-containing glycosyltransferase family 2 protein n=1 Tax=Paenibacillus doosanensis TaxID=1229154 RepID=UPI0021802B4C|nr:glycosyltransferase family 2 protein [Paenibacillus doosanensis]MCS7460414.1 glycosyltransferase family 2 protein [Paenibacillus doosanensis]